MKLLSGLNDNKAVDVVPKLIRAANLLPNPHRMEQRILLQQAAQTLLKQNQSKGRLKPPLPRVALLEEMCRCAIFISIVPPDEVRRIMLYTAEAIAKLRR